MSSSKSLLWIHQSSMSSERAAMSTLATGFKQVSVADQNAAKRTELFCFTTMSNCNESIPRK